GLPAVPFKPLAGLRVPVGPVPGGRVPVGAEAARLPRAPRRDHRRARASRTPPERTHPLGRLLRPPRIGRPPDAGGRPRGTDGEPDRDGRRSRRTVFPVGGPAHPRRAVLVVALPPHPHGHAPDRLENRHRRLLGRLLPPVDARQALLPRPLGAPQRALNPAIAHLGIAPSWRSRPIQSAPVRPPASRPPSRSMKLIPLTTSR